MAETDVIWALGAQGHLPIKAEIIWLPDPYPCSRPPWARWTLRAALSLRHHNEDAARASPKLSSAFRVLGIYIGIIDNNIFPIAVRSLWRRFTVIKCER